APLRFRLLAEDALAHGVTGEASGDTGADGEADVLEVGQIDALASRPPAHQLLVFTGRDDGTIPGKAEIHRQIRSKPVEAGTDNLAGRARIRQRASQAEALSGRIGTQEV